MSGRQEQDREDLLREATAMVERVELRVEFCPEPVFVGFRRDGSLSVFFGGDQVYQFNAKGELRRAFIDELLYKAEHGQLIELRRERTPTETLLVRRKLSEEDSAAILANMQNMLNQLKSAIETAIGEGAASDTGKFAILGEIPIGANVVGRAAHWLAQRSGQITIAANPRSGKA